MTPSIYAASKVWHAPRWRALRDRHRFNIICRWINYDSMDENGNVINMSNQEKATLWQKCNIDVQHADMMVIYVEPGEMHRGVLVEMGGFLALNKPVFVIGKNDAFSYTNTSDAAYAHHPLMHFCTSTQDLTGYCEAVAWYREKFVTPKPHIMHRIFKRA